MRATRSRKHAQVHAALARDIRSGRWKQGERLPSEAELVGTFGVSRITVTRAMRDLQAAGLVERRAGSGTYVRTRRAAGSLSLGLLIPDLGETEIFEPICQGMMASPLAGQHALLWGNTCGSARTPGQSKANCAWHLCRQYIERKVAGVFFAPLELSPDKDEMNLRIDRALGDARIPMVLLDRPLLPYPERGHHDMVGIDNRCAGYVMTEHLLQLGCRRILFVSVANAAPTVDERAAGYREALYVRNADFDRAYIHKLDPDDEEAVQELMTSQRPDGIVCANDRTAGRLMHSLRRLEYRVPQDIRLVGIDDAGYANLLPVPLTTLRQPTREIGDAAIGLMLERIARPDLPPRDIRLNCELVVRESCGASMQRSGPRR
jgi:GntR family transcriptional regulator, arabinose operon transcriptional repressor